MANVFFDKVYKCINMRNIIMCFDPFIFGIFMRYFIWEFMKNCWSYDKQIIEI